MKNEPPFLRILDKPAAPLAGKDEQSELFNPDALPQGLELLWPEEKQRGQFDASRVAHNQGRYRMIVDALAQGLPVRMICQAFAVSHHIVKIIREREAGLIATEKERMAKLFGTAARLCVEEFMERVQAGTVPAAALPVAAGIFWDKRALIEGEPTGRIEHTGERMPSLEDIARELKAIVDVETEVRSDGKDAKPQ